jgi:recombination protein RecR
MMTEFSRLPSVGPKTALRYVYKMLGLTPEQRKYFAGAVLHLNDIALCKNCYTHAERELCEVCSDPKRDRSIICVVAESRDISTIEATEQYKGLYHVLGGVLNPVDGLTSNLLRVRELKNRIEAAQEIKEIILALSPDVYGDMTMNHLSQTLKPFGRRVTKLARGLPLGADLEFADEVTLGDALSGRREI